MNDATMNVEQCLKNRHKLSLTELIDCIEASLIKSVTLHDQIDASGISICSKDYPRSLIIKLLELYSSHHPFDWHPYQSWDTSEPYSRNLIAHHPNHFTLMLVCWKGGTSPVHNHAGSDCLMAVLRGIVRETKYHIPENEYQVDELKEKETMELKEGEVHIINDQIGLHKMETSDENQRAVTLHCYIPPYMDCFTFDIEDNRIKTNIAHTTYDTEFGKCSK